MTKEAIEEKIEEVSEQPTQEQEAPVEQEAAEPSESTTEEPEKKEEVAQEEAPAEDVRVRNLRLIAKSKEKLKMEKVRLEAENKKLAEKLKQYEAQKDEFEDDEEGQPNRTNSELKKQILSMQQQQQQLLQQMAMDKAEKRLLSEHIDFADVVSTTNVSILEEIDPETTKEIMAEPDIYKKGIKAYKAIRKHKIYESANQVAANKEAIIKNMAKPKSAVSSPRKSSESSSVFADLHSRDYQNKLKQQLELAKQRV